MPEKFLALIYRQVWKQTPNRSLAIEWIRVKRRESSLSRWHFGWPGVWEKILDEPVRDTVEYPYQPVGMPEVWEVSHREERTGKADISCYWNFYGALRQLSGAGG